MYLGFLERQQRNIDKTSGWADLVERLWYSLCRSAFLVHGKPVDSFISWQKRARRWGEAKMDIRWHPYATLGGCLLKQITYTVGGFPLVVCEFLTECLGLVRAFCQHSCRSIFPASAQTMPVITHAKRQRCEDVDVLMEDNDLFRTMNSSSTKTTACILGISSKHRAFSDRNLTHIRVLWPRRHFLRVTICTTAGPRDSSEITLWRHHCGSRWYFRYNRTVTPF